MTLTLYGLVAQKVDQVQNTMEEMNKTSNITMINVAYNKFALDRKEDREILNWLTAINYGLQHSDYRTRRQPGTGLWLLDAKEYKTWRSTPAQTLFCPGMPGAGKTILTSIVIDDLKQTFSDDNAFAIAYIYCNFKRKDEQKIENMMANLLKQLVQAMSSFPDALKQLYENHCKNGTRPTLQETYQTLRSVASAYSRVFIVVDALDECQTSNDYAV